MAFDPDRAEEILSKFRFHVCRWKKLERETRVKESKLKASRDPRGKFALGCARIGFFLVRSLENWYHINTYVIRGGEREKSIPYNSYVRKKGVYKHLTRVYLCC